MHLPPLRRSSMGLGMMLSGTLPLNITRLALNLHSCIRIPSTSTSTITTLPSTRRRDRPHYLQSRRPGFRARSLNRRTRRPRRLSPNSPRNPRRCNIRIGIMVRIRKILIAVLVAGICLMEDDIREMLCLRPKGLVLDVPSRCRHRWGGWFRCEHLLLSPYSLPG